MGDGVAVGEGLGVAPPSDPPALTMDTAVTRPYRSRATKAFCGHREGGGRTR